MADADDLHQARPDSIADDVGADSHDFSGITSDGAPAVRIGLQLLYCGKQASGKSLRSQRCVMRVNVGARRLHLAKRPSGDDYGVTG